MKCCTKLETAAERCPIVFQGHPSNFEVTWDKTSPILYQIGRFWTIGRSQLSNPSDLPCLFKYVFWWCPIDNKLALVQTVACRQTGAKLLPEPVMIQFADVFKYLSLGLNEYTHWINVIIYTDPAWLTVPHKWTKICWLATAN